MSSANGLRRRTCDRYLRPFVNRPPGLSRATAGPGKPLSRDPITTSFLCAEIETPSALRGRKPGEGCPLTIRLWVWGSVVSSPMGSGAPPKTDLCIGLFQVRKKPSGTPFSVFLSNDRAPQMSWGPGKLSPLSSPLDGPVPASSSSYSIRTTFTPTTW